MVFWIVSGLRVLMPGLLTLRRRRMGIPFQNTLLRPIPGALGLRHPWLRTVLKGGTHPTLRLCACLLSKNVFRGNRTTFKGCTYSTLHTALGGRWEWVSKTVRSHGWRSPSVTWTCRKERVLDTHSQRALPPKIRAIEASSSNQSFRQPQTSRQHPCQCLRTW